MKAIIAGVMIVGIGGMIVLAQYNKPLEVTNVKDVATTTTEVVEEIDVVKQAAENLERINKELDEEETRLMDERNVIDSKLEKIRETRMSF